MTQTRHVRINPDEPESDKLDEAVRLLRRGGLVAIPTETVYGLAANALDAEAVHAIFNAKGRPSTNPVIVHVAHIADARSLSSAWPVMANQLAKEFWPGPLTLIVRKSDRVPDVITAGGPTVAIRIPSHPVAHALLRESGMPLAAPSANRSQNLSPTRAEHVMKDLNGRIDLVLDAGPTPGGIESTVIDLVHGPRILRPGPISSAAIEKILGRPCPTVIKEVSLETPSRSPGQMARHYAPRTRLECCSDARERVEEYLNQGKRVGWLSLGNDVGLEASVVRMPSDPVTYASRLYDELHLLDDRGLDVIVVTAPPNEVEWLAILDRLRRASTR